MGVALFIGQQTPSTLTGRPRADQERRDMIRRQVAILAMLLGLLYLGAPPTAWADGCGDRAADHGGGGGCGGSSGGSSGGGGGGSSFGSETLTSLFLEGFVDVPDEYLNLPLGPADPAVIVVVTFGIPAVQVPVTITPDTRIRDEKGNEADVIQLTDGDRVQLGIQVIGDVLWARRLQLQEFPEVKLEGVADEVPGGAVSLPLLPSGSTTILVRLGGSTLTLPVVITGQTKLDPPTFTINDGDLIRVKAIVNNLQIVAVKLELAN
jgi:hypothetical protein